MTSEAEGDRLGRILAIGDVHGCNRALRTLLDAVDPQADDTIVLLGDLIDRGSDSAGVLETLLEWRRRCQVVYVRGNHEEMMMAALDGTLPLAMWEACGGDATLSSYGGKLERVPATHREFLESSRLFYEVDTHFFIHANYVAELPLEEQPTSVAMWLHLSTMVPPPHCSGKTAVVGHTPQKDGDILDLGHLICIDTFCVGGRWLTALDVREGKAWQANEAGAVREQAGVKRVGSA